MPVGRQEQVKKKKSLSVQEMPTYKSAVWELTLPVCISTFWEPKLLHTIITAELIYLLILFLYHLRKSSYSLSGMFANILWKYVLQNESTSYVPQNYSTDSIQSLWKYQVPCLQKLESFS